MCAVRATLHQAAPATGETESILYLWRGKVWAGPCISVLFTS